MGASRTLTLEAVLQLPVGEVLARLPPYTLHRCGLGPYVGCSGMPQETVAEGAAWFGRDPELVARLVLEALKALG